MRHPASFRDPSGYVYSVDGELYRQVNQSYSVAYDKLMQGGLYDKLSQAGKLVSHEEVSVEPLIPDTCYKILKPQLVNYVSYPYEWSFSQLRDAALLTLDIQIEALNHDMTLKDASAYNVLFEGCNPVLIDSLSFDVYEEGLPWQGYRQFCQHFLAPLILMADRDLRLGQLSKNFIDGIPLDLASKLLPRSTWFRPGSLMHLHMHAKSQTRYERDEKAVKTIKRGMSKFALTAMIDSLRSLVASMKTPRAKTEWGEYYDFTNYSDEAGERKAELVGSCLDKIKPNSVWDMGANTGVYSRIASSRGIPTVAFDIDPVAVDANYQNCRSKKEENLLPLILDLTNPSPGLGWDNTERQPIHDRGAPDCIMALALIHHLAISNNVPLEEVAGYFSRLSRSLVIEFVPKSDSQVKILLATRDDIFPQYTVEGFEAAFSEYYEIDEKFHIEGTERFLFAMTRKS